VLVSSVAVLASCGGESQDEGSVRAFTDVQVGEFAFDADPTDPDRGIFRVTTAVPMICAIVWGDTEEFGNFNNSLAMNGTGITQHDVHLPGTVPGRTYYFQVQGSTADGTLYRSETGTFTIEAIPPSDDAAAADSGLNLAPGGTVLDVSSEFNGNFAAVNAIDDAGTTEWSSNGDGDNAFITIDLGASHPITGVEFITRSMLDGSAITETFMVTVDDGERFGPFPAGTAIDPNRADLQTTGRVLRIDVDTSSGGNVGAVEIRILGAD
jgi:hypothetical protein